MKAVFALVILCAAAAASATEVPASAAAASEGTITSQSPYELEQNEPRNRRDTGVKGVTGVNFGDHSFNPSVNRNNRYRHLPCTKQGSRRC